MAYFVRLLVVLIMCAPCLRLAQGAERLVDALATYALQERTAVADGLERDILAVIDSSPNEDRFDLYRTYNQLMGTWVQVDLSQTLVEQAVATTSPSEEEEIRTTLRDQAQFALWDLDEALAYVGQNSPIANRREYLRINEGLRSLLSETKIIIGRLLADQCDYLQCAGVP